MTPLIVSYHRWLAAEQDVHDATGLLRWLTRHDDSASVAKQKVVVAELRRQASALLGDYLASMGEGAGLMGKHSQMYSGALSPQEALSYKSSPLHDGSSASPAIPSSHSQDAMPAKILIVDDYPETLAIYRELYEMQGYEVFTAVSGDEAVEQFVRHAPTLVLIDEDPGEMSGIALVARLKHIALKSGDGPLRAIAIRGDYLRGVPPTLPGFDYVLSKPLDFDHLDGLVRACVIAMAALVDRPRLAET